MAQEPLRLPPRGPVMEFLVVLSMVALCVAFFALGMVLGRK